MGLDLGLGAAGVLIGVSSLAYPFGRDQGLYHYVAREWLRGSVPYRDVFDHKTPGIYLAHVLAIRVFGTNMWGIRVLDLLAMVALGVLAGSATFKRGQIIPAGVRGAAVVLASVLLFGCLNYWDTSQSEVWYSMLGLGAVWAVRRIDNERVAFAVAGAFSAAVMVMKPPGMWLVFVALWQLAARVRENDGGGTRSRRDWLRRLGVAVGWFALGGLLVAGPVLGYFAAKGALPEMYRIAVKGNAYYIKHETGVHSASDIPFHLLDYLFEYNPFSTVGLLGTGAAFAVVHDRADRVARERLLMACVLCLAAYASVCMQLKFYRLHWTVLLGPVTALYVLLALEAANVHPRLAKRPAQLLVVVTLLMFVMTDWRMRAWLDMNLATVAYARGRMPREQYAAKFNFPETDFSYADSERVGLYVAEHTSADDFVAVRGFQPEIYAISGRSYPGRFFWTTFITSEVRETPEQRAKWLDEDTRALASHPPKFVVTLARVREGPDSSAWFEPKGYAPVFVTATLAVLARPEAGLPTVSPDDDDPLRL